MFSAGGPATQAPGPIAGTVKDGPDADGLILIGWQANADVDTDAADGYERVRWVSRDGYQPRVDDEAVMVLDLRGDAWAIVVPSAGVTSGAPANARLAGADPTGVADATATIQNLLDTVNHTVVPPGTYRIDGTLTIGDYRTLETMIGATLLRDSGHSAATTPVARLNGSNYSRLIGQGTVQSLNASPQGIVHVGPAVQTVTANVQRWRVRDVTLIGASALTTNLGLNITSSEAAGPTGTAAGSNYLGSAADLDIQQVGVGVKVGEQCNAHNFSNIVLHLIGAYSYHLAGGANGVAENSFYGGFTHTKASGNITVLKLERAYANEFYGVKAEPDAPGAPGSLLAHLDANSHDNVLFSRANMETVAQIVDLGTDNLILDKRRLQVGQLDARRGGVVIPVVGSTPTDGTFTARGVPATEGLMAFDVVNLKLHIRDNTGVWRQVALA
jgi:hypothetical protein